MEKINLLSLIVPTYKQEKTIIQNIKMLKETLSTIPISFEIIIVVDGFVDKTYEKLRNIRDDKVRVLGYKENLGKGYAVKYGMLRAKGDVIGFIDGGMDIDPTGISMLLNHMLWYNADIVIGSKLHPVSRVNYPAYRRILSWGYRLFIHMLFGLSIRDTQVGLKLYRKEVVEQVFPRILVKKFAFDIETLAVARSLGYSRIYEAPVKLKFHEGASSIDKHLTKTILLMLWDTAAVFYRLRILNYYNQTEARTKNNV